LGIVPRKSRLKGKRLYHHIYAWGVAKRVGHVFGERFNNRIVQPNNYGLWLSRYIHRQPVEAGIISDPKDYQWTSYRAYIGLAPKGFLKPAVILDQFGRDRAASQRYQEFVLAVENGPVDWRKASGLIIGDAKFVEEEIAESIDDEKDDAWLDEDLLEVLSERLRVKPELLLKPRGLVLRKLRHKAFVILEEKYGLSAARIARLFKVSATAVIKVLKK